MSAYRIARTCIEITLLFLFVFSYSFSRIVCWNFEAANLPEDTFIWKFAIWRNRAFLNIPREGKNESLVNGMTLFEAIWPESNLSRVKRSKLFSSNSRGKPIDDGCPRSIVKLDVDIRGRLWLLQVPDSYDCSARIVVYNLKRSSNLVLSTDLSNVPAKNLRALVIDASGSKAYLGDPGDESIIAFLPEKERWWRIMMVHGPEVPRVVSTDIAISRNNSVLYMSGSDTLHLFSINLDELWNEQNVSAFNDKSRNVRVDWHGTKMGTSSGLICDFNDGLHYFMSSERASVRWDTKLPLRAESHTILVQNENCPCITDYAIDSRKNLWGLVNSKCRFESQESSQKLRFKSRTIKIMKYPTL
ncbi:uncharacterized protein LOC105664198 isoform X1 [Megachile rotundata]|uniref:uncharacterized protein LOC105664198 isoform X1 n=2 Tax=Megachile rotundata TaxID=143995 RepID=UPI003FD27BD8